MWCSAADTHLELLDRVVGGTHFLTGGVFECDIAHRRSVTVLCMPYKIRCNPMHPHYGALPSPYVPVCRTSDALVAYWYTYAPSCCGTSQYRGPLFPSQYPCIRWCGTGRFQEQGQCVFIGISCSIHFCLILFFHFFSFCLYSISWYCGAGVFELIGCISLSPSCTADL